MNLLQRLFGRGGGTTGSGPDQEIAAVVESAKQGLGPDLVGVLAYGSWASGEFVAGHSNVNLLVITRRLDPETLKRLAPIAGQWHKLSGVKPLLFSATELKAFSDAFPMEFGDIAENHRLLTGEDPFQRMQVSYHRLLDELETEIRNRLVKLRQRYLLSGGSLEEARALLAATAGSMFPILRAFLRLKRRRPPNQRVRLIEECCRNYRFGRRTLLQAHDLRYGRKNAETIDTVELFNHMVAELQGMAEQVQRMRSEGPQASGAAAAPQALAPGQGGEDRDRERGDRPRDRDRDRDREHPRRRESFGAKGGDRSAKLAAVRALIQDASGRKKWEPREPERFLSDEFSRDAGLSSAARFGWDRAWQPERRAKGYVPKLEPVEAPAEEEPYSDEEVDPQLEVPAEPAAAETMAAGETVTPSPQETTHD
ncbi:MAG: hypothetical protein V4498_05880 [candidate division FCPU426 bacterium]